MEQVDVREVPGELQNKEQRGIKRKIDQSSRCARQGSNGWRRPKRPLSFQVSSGQQDGSGRLSTTTAASALEHRIHLLNLIIRRNKNQHRSQSFFKYLCLLRSSLTKLLAVSSRLSKLSRATADGARTSEQIRHNFEIEASLRSQKEFVEEHVREALVPKCYVTFSGLVADSQFGNLGVVLVALLSEIVCGSGGVGPMRELHGEEGYRLSKSGKGEEAEPENISEWSRSLIVTSTRATGEDQGEVVQRVYDRGMDEKEDTADAEAATVVHQAAPAESDENQVFAGDSVQDEIESVLSTALKEPESAASVVVTQTLSSRSPESSTMGLRITTTSKKKRKRKNPIDDLFSGLV